MATQKAYKLLAMQENISNNEAKELIDAGLISVQGEKLTIARSEIDAKSVFKVIRVPKTKIIFEDDNIIAVNKAAFTLSEKIASNLKATLLNRLDKETSGVLLLCKNEDFLELAIDEYKANRVKKIYVAMVKGVVSEPFTIDEPILTLKGKNGAFSKIDEKGKNAITHVTPLMVIGKKSLVKVEIQTGRTHQIRVHLATHGFGVIGDMKYAKIKADRMFLHSYKTEIFDYKFVALLDRSFSHYDFNVPYRFEF